MFKIEQLSSLLLPESGIPEMIRGPSRPVFIEFPDTFCYSEPYLTFGKIPVPVRMGLGNLESQRRELHHVVLIDFYPRREDTKRVRQPERG